MRARHDGDDARRRRPGFSGGAARRHSDLLLVSKRWLRVGLPLLYSMLYIDGKHTRTIVSALRTNPGLGSAVRSLRVDGIHDKAVLDFVSLVPNVENMHLNLDMALHNEACWYGSFLAIGPPKALYFYHARDDTPDVRPRLHDTAMYHILVNMGGSAHSSPVSYVLAHPDI